MTDNPLVFVDVETTGLDPTTHHVVEVAWAVEDGPIKAFVPWHTLDGATPDALTINRYFERDLDRMRSDDQPVGEADLLRDLRGATLVGCNPAFDAAFLRKTLGVQLWKHRLIDVAACAMWQFGWDRPRGLADIARALRENGYDIPEPDHTAAGDVSATRSAYQALLDLRGRA
jgi:DNA polymerase III epsilon subunit-like protein